MLDSSPHLALPFCPCSIFPVDKLQEVQLDAARQRTRRIEADARLKEKEEGDRVRSAAAASGREELQEARKATEVTRARLAGDGCVFCARSISVCAVRGRDTMFVGFRRLCVYLALLMFVSTTEVQTAGKC